MDFDCTPIEASGTTLVSPNLPFSVLFSLSLDWFKTLVLQNSLDFLFSFGLVLLVFCTLHLVFGFHILIVSLYVVMGKKK